MNSFTIRDLPILWEITDYVGNSPQQNDLTRDIVTWAWIRIMLIWLAFPSHLEVPACSQSLMEGMPAQQVDIPMDQVIEVWESTAYEEGMETTWYVVHRYMDEDLRMAICYIVSEGKTCKGHCYVWALEDVAVQIASLLE